jgi:hypothetical protein
MLIEPRRRYHFSMELFTALSGLKTASDLTTRLREAIASRELKLDEAVARIIEIQCHISDAHTNLNNVQGQLHEQNRQAFQLEQEVRSLKEQLAKKAQGRKHDNAVWKVLEDGTEDGPYCPNCFETTRNFIQPYAGAVHPDVSFFFCGEHGDKNFSFKVPNRLCGNEYTERPPQARPRFRMDLPGR